MEMTNIQSVERNIVSVALADIQPSTYNTRKNFDEASLAGLADSIRQHGVLQTCRGHKFAAVEKENAKLKAENERMKKAFAKAVKDKAEERTKALTAEKLKKFEVERDKALVQSCSLAI